MGGSRTKHWIRKPGGSQKDTKYDVLLLKSVPHTHLGRRSASIEEGSALQTLSKAKSTWYLKYTSDGLIKAFNCSFPIWCPRVAARFLPQLQSNFTFRIGQLASRADGNSDCYARSRMLKPERQFCSAALGAELRNITYGAGMYVVTSAEPQQ